MKLVFKWFCNCADVTVTRVTQFCCGVISQTLAFIALNLYVMFNSSNSENLIALGPDEGLQCTTSSTNMNFSSCHSEELVEKKAFFIANFVVIILFGGISTTETISTSRPIHNAPVVQVEVHFECISRYRFHA